jgi:chromosome segregation ATPase
MCPTGQELQTPKEPCPESMSMFGYTTILQGKPDLAQAVAEIARLKAVIQHQAGLIQQHEHQLIAATQQVRDEVTHFAIKAHASMAAARVEQARHEGVAKGIEFGRAGLEAAVAKAEEDTRARHNDFLKTDDSFSSIRRSAFEEGRAAGAAQQEQLRQELLETKRDLARHRQQADSCFERCSRLKKAFEERLQEEASLKKSKAVLQDRVDRLRNQKQELQQEVYQLTQKLATLGYLETAERKPDVRVVKCPSNYPKPYSRGQEDPRYRPSIDCTHIRVY